MQASLTLAELFALMSFMGAGIWLIGLVLYWLDTWLDNDIAQENAENESEHSTSEPTMAA